MSDGLATLVNSLVTKLDTPGSRVQADRLEVPDARKRTAARPCTCLTYSVSYLGTQSLAHALALQLEISGTTVPSSADMQEEIMGGMTTKLC